MQWGSFLLVGAAGLCIVGRSLGAWDARQNYPQWRGQQRDGAASGFVEPRVWPEALTRRWKVNVGEGYATPLVIGGTVYVFFRHNEDEVLRALDAKTGVTQWESTYPAPYVPSQPSAKHGAGPKATPLYHEGHLFTMGISGVLSAFDAATGSRIWHTAAPAEPPFFSAASSPLGEAGLVIVHPGNYGPLTAFDSRTGEIKWTAGSNGFFSSPISVTLGGTHQIVSATQDSVIGVSLDGRVLWQSPWSGGGGSTTPVTAGEFIIVSGLDQGVRALRPIVRNGKWVAEMVWETKNVSMYISNPVLVGNTLFGLSHRAGGQFFAIDAQSGAVLWLGRPREAENTALVKSHDVLFLLKDDAELVVAKASRGRFDPIVHYTVADSATWAQPSISGNRIFIKDVTALSLWTVD